MPLLRSLSEALARLARPGPSGPADRLESLDARMLHDLGLDVSELGSVQAEHRGEAMLSRRRILVAGRHG